VQSEAFERVYKANSELVRRICLRMLRDPIEAEDAAQDVFVCVLLKLHTFRGESALSSWLYRLTTNLVLMRFRKNNHKQVSLCELLGGNGELLGDIGKPDLYLNGVLDRVDLELLSICCRMVIEPYFSSRSSRFRSRGNSQTLWIFGWEFESQLHKARRRLRELLAAKPGKGPPPEANQTRLLAVAQRGPQSIRLVISTN